MIERHTADVQPAFDISSWFFCKEIVNREDVILTSSIFYFDDEIGCLDIFESLFNDEYDVRTATSLAEARRMLSERPADIIISDQIMPEIEGTDFLRDIARLSPESHRILLTGRVTLGNVLPEISGSIVHQFIAKPWLYQEMTHALERALATSEMHARDH